MSVVNIAAYKFVSIPDRLSLQPVLKKRCDELELKGTILLAEEGINFNLAGSKESVEQILDFLRNEELFASRFSDLEVKISLSDNQPFRKMIVRLPREIITMKHPAVVPASGRAPSVEPSRLKVWLDQGFDDEGREVVMLDTRNDYEVDEGAFENALDFRIETFSEFPAAVEKAIGEADSKLKDKTIVTYCTGGIRCEKAALFMQELELPHIYQLEGGILNYFAEVGGSHWRGECFVFDERYALDPDLKPTSRVRENKPTSSEAKEI